MKRHISILGEEIRQYFPDLEDFRKYCSFVNNPWNECWEICLHKIIYFKNSLLIWWMMECEKLILWKT